MRQHRKFEAERGGGVSLPPLPLFEQQGRHVEDSYAYPQTEGTITLTCDSSVKETYKSDAGHKKTNANYIFAVSLYVIRMYILFQFVLIYLKEGFSSISVNFSSISVNIMDI